MTELPVAHTQPETSSAPLAALLRTSAVALNAYREAVRARALHALFGLALAVTGYSLVLGTLSLHQDARVVADVGAASASLFSVLLAILLAATTLHREVEQKTLYPILTRRLLRHEYILGKYAGISLVLMAFLCTDSALTLTLLATRVERPWLPIAAAIAGFFVTFGAFAAVRRTRTFALLPAALVFLLLACVAAGPAGGERQLILGQMLLSACEAMVVLAITLVLAAFSSPFVTAACAIGVFLVGRSADTLATLPVRLFGETIRDAGAVLSKLTPNLQIFVPERPLLLGEAEVTPALYILKSAGLAAAYVVFLLSVAAMIFQRRDFE